MKLPDPRGPVSAGLIAELGTEPHPLDPELAAAVSVGAAEPPAGLAEPPAGLADATAALIDEDLQLTLFICYELHYRGWDGVDERWEWHPELLRLRGAAERRFEAALRALPGSMGDNVPEIITAATIARVLVSMTGASTGPSLSGFLRGRATLAQFREFATHRAVYHLREADPHTFAIPRLNGRAKAALVEIQLDEYGGGRLDRMHQEMFRATMRWLKLDTTYGAYVNDVPALTLATNNVMSLFGLHRRFRGALLGHLAAYEMTSTLPNRAYGNGLRRLGGCADATRFYDEHVQADAAHEQIAAYDMCGSFCVSEPEATPDVFFGARCALTLDSLWATQVLARWAAGQGSLRGELRLAA